MHKQGDDALSPGTASERLSGLVSSGEPMPATPHKLRCEERLEDGRPCSGILGIYWQPKRKRRLHKGEDARYPNDVTWCPDCKAKWEIAPPLKECA